MDIRVHINIILYPLDVFCRCYLIKGSKSKLNLIDLKKFFHDVLCALQSFFIIDFDILQYCFPQENQNEISPQICQTIKKISNKQGNTGNPCGLLLRMQTRTATMENSMEVSQKVKKELPYNWQSFFF